jgi:hypothetical protein
MMATLQEFPDFGNGIHFELSDDAQAVVFELPGNRINWMVYETAPEPELRGHSVTLQVG